MRYEVAALNSPAGEIDDVKARLARGEREVGQPDAVAMDEGTGMRIERGLGFLQ
jgi:hypothetical protein